MFILLRKDCQFLSQLLSIRIGQVVDNIFHVRFDEFYQVALQAVHRLICCQLGHLLS